MKMILIASVCALALTAMTTAADAGHRKKWRNYSWQQNGYQQNGWNQQNGWQQNRAFNGANAQALYGGNPDAGGGPRGSTQATNNPNASREYGGR